ncbi:hypothetical protein FOMPIDRAFT_88320 [Fomitopsis schrenkii]|uniref:MI domain-containing protein n=1 Tax=Fomitopsis schrenkii TaxID=2126942 RepID=S8E5M1_FOMSC|nr:hypothetical protein FOMPIDRAFT_88320 [Fomitopsis schrenkii]
MGAAPLQHPVHRWRPPSVGTYQQQPVDTDSPEIVDRKVVRLVFEKATDEPTWNEMYARLCRKMMEQISPKVQDEGIKNAEGKPVAEDFECGWAAKHESGKVVFSEEYYAAQKAKRQGLGLFKFIGELFKLQMLTERIMYECVKKLLRNVENPKEGDIESLCMLLKTVGELLDTAKARAHVDVYFSRMKELMKNPNISYRMVFMLLDLIELRERKWKSRHAAAGPTTISEVHALAAKEIAAKEMEYQRTLGRSRGWSRRRGDRGQHQVGLDGCALAGNAPSRPPPKAGDLTHIDKISKTNSMTFGPTGVLAKDKGKRESAVPSIITTTRPDTKVGELLSIMDEQVKADLKAAAETFFKARDLEDGKKAFSDCAPEHRWRLINRLVFSATMRGDQDARLVGELFSRTTQMGLCPGETFELGVAPVIDTLDVLSLHIPAAPRLVATMLKGADVDSVLLEKLARRALGDDMELLIGLLL